MKKTYLTPVIRIQSIDSEEVLEASLPIFDDNNPATVKDDVITDGTEVLGNESSVWDTEEE